MKPQLAGSVKVTYLQRDRDEDGELIALKEGEEQYTGETCTDVVDASDFVWESGAGPHLDEDGTWSGSALYKAYCDGYYFTCEIDIVTKDHLPNKLTLNVESEALVDFVWVDQLTVASVPTSGVVAF